MRIQGVGDAHSLERGNFAAEKVPRFGMAFGAEIWYNIRSLEK